MSLSLSFVWKSDSFAIWVWNVTTTRSREAIPIIPGAQGREWRGRSSQLLARDTSYKQQPSHSSKYQAGWRARVQVKKKTKNKQLHFSSSFFLKILLVGGLFQVKRLASPATEPSQPSNVPRQIGRHLSHSWSFPKHHRNSRTSLKNFFLTVIEEEFVCNQK